MGSGRILAINGNHDVEAADLPSALELFAREMYVHPAPNIWHTSGCTVATLPWAPVSRLVAARNGGDRDTLHAEAAALLIQTARGLRERIDGPAVLMLHWSISGASTPTGMATDDFREVVLDATELEALGFDAIVAGHIHKPQFIGGQDSEHTNFYVGSPAPVDFGEADSPHGCYVLDTESGDCDFIEIQSRPFVTHEFDLTTHEGIFDLANLPQIPDGAVVRVRYRATEEQARRIDQGEIRRSLYQQGAHKVYAIQATIEREQRARVEGVDETLGPMQALVLWADANELGEQYLQPLEKLTATYLEAGV